MGFLIYGGIMVGLLSNSEVSVSDPAAGLAVIVAESIISIGSFEAFLVAVILAGLIQLIMGLLKAGWLSSFFPDSVIKGMLVGRYPHLSLGIDYELREVTQHKRNLPSHAAAKLTWLGF